MEDSWLLRKERRACAAIREQQIAELRLAMLESAMLRSEIKAYRDNRQDETATGAMARAAPARSSRS
jgi:hypothetical protein